MKRPHQVSLVVFTCYLLINLLIGCASSVELASPWRDQAISIDGQLTDWQNATTEVERAHATIGVKNDNEYLYVCFATNERRTQMQTLAFGLTVWLDPAGGKNKTFGIHYPIGGQASGRRLLSRGNPDDLRPLLESIPYEFEIVNSETDDRRRVLFIDAKDISARFGYAQGTLVYELKIPLRKTGEHPIAITTEIVNNLGIGFETSEPSQDASSGRAVSGRAAGGGRSGGRSGGRTAPPRDIDVGSSRPQSLSLWAIAKLAPGAPSATK